MSQRYLEQFEDVKFEALRGANARKVVLVVGIMAAHALGEGLGLVCPSAVSVAGLRCALPTCQQARVIPAVSHNREVCKAIPADPYRGRILGGLHSMAHMAPKREVDSCPFTAGTAGDSCNWIA